MSIATRITTGLGRSIECTMFTHYDSETRIVPIECSGCELNPGLKRGRRGVGRCTGRRGQMYGEDGTRRTGACEFEFAVMGFGNPLCDRKAEAGAAAGVGAGAGLVGAEESLEDARLEFGGDAQAVVGNGELGS